MNYANEKAQCFMWVVGYPFFLFWWYKLAFSIFAPSLNVINLKYYESHLGYLKIVGGHFPVNECTFMENFLFGMTCSEHELACCPFLIINLLYSSKFCLSMQNMQAFSHPEVQLGFHPDAGASFYLSRLPGYLGDITVMPFWFCAICFSPSTSRLRSVRIVLWFSFWISYSWILETWFNCELRC